MIKSVYTAAKNMYMFTLVLGSIIKAFKLFMKSDSDANSHTELRIKGLNHDIKIRNHTVDKNVIKYVFYHKYHVPPAGFTMPKNATIVDLGTNIGLTVVHMKHLYPDAKILGFEMDQDNFGLATANTKPYENVEVFNRAVWIENTTVKYSKAHAFDSYHVNPTNPAGDIIEVQSITIDEIIRANNLSKIDYLKMDIEGVEEKIFDSENLEWLKIVDSMNIEFHLEDETYIDHYIDIIKNQGFDAWVDTKHWSSIMAVRKN